MLKDSETEIYSGADSNQGSDMKRVSHLTEERLPLDDEKEEELIPNLRTLRVGL